MSCSPGIEEPQRLAGDEDEIADVFRAEKPSCEAGIQEDVAPHALGDVPKGAVGQGRLAVVQPSQLMVESALRADVLPPRSSNSMKSLVVSL
jgi:hypothetical protein